MVSPLVGLSRILVDPQAGLPTKPRHRRGFVRLPGAVIRVRLTNPPPGGRARNNSSGPSCAMEHAAAEAAPARRYFFFGRYRSVMVPS